MIFLSDQKMFEITKNNVNKNKKNILYRSCTILTFVAFTSETKIFGFYQFARMLYGAHEKHT